MRLRLRTAYQQACPEEVRHPPRLVDGRRLCKMLPGSDSRGSHWRSASLAEQYGVLMRVLLVDAIADEREMYGEGLRDCGYEVVLTDRLDLVRIATMSPDVLILHVGSEGWGPCESLQLAYPDLPVIALTAAVRPDRANRDRARALPNCAAFVGKPCTHTVLADVISRVARGERGIELSSGTIPPVHPHRSPGIDA